jgi:hypothetical protein
MIQLEFFNDRTYEDVLKEEVNQIRDSTEKVRKSLFARHAELAKKYLELNERLEILERNICKSTNA